MGHAGSKQKCCTGLTAALGANKVLLPGSTGYNASLSSYFSLQAAAAHPLCIVAPQTTQDVSAAIASLTRDGSCDFAIRSGGHAWFPGGSNADGGVTIDLRSLDAIALSHDNASVSVGMGATWDAVYAYLDPLGLSVAGGRVSSVGVGGVTLGGGISFFGPRRGWTCNQAISFEVVLANGSVVQAGETENSDLWWGLRGGSNNFGVVTSVRLETFAQGLLWSAMTFTTLDVVEDQAGIYSDLMEADGYDENASFLMGWGFSEAQGVAVGINQLIYTRPTGNDTPALYQDLLDLPTVSPASPTVASMKTLADQALLLQPINTAQVLTATMTILPTKDMLLAVYDAFNSSLQSIQTFAGVAWSVFVEPIPPQLYARGASDNALGLANRDGSLAVFLLSASWSDPSRNGQVYAAAAALVADVEARARSIGAFDPYLYLNYAASWQTDVIESYGPASVRRLQALRRSVDPRGVFTSMVPGGFKVPY